MRSLTSNLQWQNQDCFRTYTNTLIVYNYWFTSWMLWPQAWATIMLLSHITDVVCWQVGRGGGSSCCFQTCGQPVWYRQNGSPSSTHQRWAESEKFHWARVTRFKFNKKTSDSGGQWQATLLHDFGNIKTTSFIYNNVWRVFFYIWHIRSLLFVQQIKKITF